MEFYLELLTMSIKMATKIDRLVQQAKQCFTRCNKKLPDTFQNDLVVLKGLVDEVTVTDVKLLRYVLQKAEKDFISKKPKSKIDPVDYLRIYENDDVSIGVFVLKQGAKIPIHDHPSMHGILKVLQGVIKVTNYSVIGTDTTTSIESRLSFYKHPLKVTKHPEAIISEQDGCSTLTPTERNVHEVECVTGPAAFLDILAPPYDEGRPSKPRGCHYFKEVENTANDGYDRLVQTPNPVYWVEPNEDQ